MVTYSYYNSLINQYGNWYSVWTGDAGHSMGDGYRDFTIHDEFPVLRTAHAQYELDFHQAADWSLGARMYSIAAPLAAVFYVIFVFIGPRVMAARKPLELRGPLFLWNLLLTIFSVISTLRLVPHILYGLWINDTSYFFCRNAHDAYAQGASGLWANLFIFSKFVELIDTVFLVLRKKPVSFLHWFHHATVLMYCWHALQYQMPTGIFFAAMNSVVHSVMYAYYTIAAVSRPPKWGMFVTVIQIVQMFIGMFITAYHYYLLKSIPNCDGSFVNLTAASVMYTAYMLLFVEFFVSRYFKKASADRKLESTSKKRD
jgi:hypothetical protein